MLRLQVWPQLRLHHDPVTVQHNKFYQTAALMPRYQETDRLKVRQPAALLLTLSKQRYLSHFTAACVTLASGCWCWGNCGQPARLQISQCRVPTTVKRRFHEDQSHSAKAAAIIHLALIFSSPNWKSAEVREKTTSDSVLLRHVHPDKLGCFSSTRLSDDRVFI